MKRKYSLYEEMKDYYRKKKVYAIGLISVGIVGLVLPVIPGILLIGMGLALLSPKYGTELIVKAKNWFKSLLPEF